MPIYAKASSSTFTPAPAGTWAAVCVDVVDLGVLEITFAGETKKQHKIRVVWQLEEINSDTGKPYLAYKRYTLSLHEKAALRKDLESWRGRPFTDQELEGFDVETVIGVGAMLNIIEKKEQGKTYSNVTGVMKLPRGMAAPTPRDYVRVIDRQEQERGMDQRPPEHFEEASQFITDDDVPF